MRNEMCKKEFKNFMHNVTWLRRRYGISKKKMAEILGIGVWSLNKIEKGEFPPRLTVDILFNIKDYFGVYPQRLIEQRLDNQFEDRHNK